MKRSEKPPRARRPVDERRAQLVELGLDLFSARPYDDVSIDDIASGAGISKGLLYHYFGSKRGFYVACVRVAAERLIEATVPDASVPPEARARAGLEAYLAYAAERAPAYIALMRSGLGSDAEVQAIVEGTREAIIERALRTLGVDPRRPLPRLAVRSWIGQVEAACLEWLERGGVTKEALVTLLLGTADATFALAATLEAEADPGGRV